MNVLGFVRDPDSKRLLLMRRASGMLNGVAGTMRDGESPAQAMARKLEEETGLVTDASMWVERLVLHGDTQTHVLTLTHPIFAATKREDEIPAFYEFLDWAREPVVSNLKWIIPLVFSPELAGIGAIPHAMLAL